MTVKSILLAVGLVAGFAAFLIVTWDISAWMVREPETTVERAPAALKPNQGIEANTAGQDEQTEGEAKPEAVQDVKTDQQPPEEPGAYDDSWIGTDKQGRDVGLKAVPGADQPAVDPYATDDREDSDSGADAGPAIPPAQSDDPYQGDHRESN